MLFKNSSHSSQWTLHSKYLATWTCRRYTDLADTPLHVYSQNRVFHLHIIQFGEKHNCLAKSHGSETLVSLPMLLALRAERAWTSFLLLSFWRPESNQLICTFQATPILQYSTFLLLVSTFVASRNALLLVIPYFLMELFTLRRKLLCFSFEFRCKLMVLFWLLFWEVRFRKLENLHASDFDCLTRVQWAGLPFIQRLSFKSPFNPSPYYLLIAWLLGENFRISNELQCFNFGLIFGSTFVFFV